MTTNSYHAGETIRLQGTFTNTGGTLTTPTAGTLVLIPAVQWGGVVPGSVQYTLGAGQLTNPSAGSLYYDLRIPSGTPGVWTYSYIGSGNLNAVFTKQFNVYQEPTP